MAEQKFAHSRIHPQAPLVSDSDSISPVPAPGEKSAARPPDGRHHWFRTLSHHPIFAVLVFVLFSKLIGEFYPISPFSMYSNPSTEPLIFCYVADGEGKALPILWHSGQTPARLTKKQRAERSVLEQEIEKRTGRGKDELTEEEDRAIRAQAGREVLEYVIDLSQKRSQKRHLKPPLQLVEVAIGLDDDGLLTETPRVVAELTTADEAEAYGDANKEIAP